MIVNLVDSPDNALQGVLWRYRWGWITLRDAAALAAGQQPTKIDGEVVLHVSRVAYFQVVTP